MGGCQHYSPWREIFFRNAGTLQLARALYISYSQPVLMWILYKHFGPAPEPHVHPLESLNYPRC